MDKTPPKASSSRERRPRKHLTLAIRRPTLNVVHRMTMEEYERLCPYQDDLHENWGPPPGHLNSDGQNLLVFGAKFGNVFIGAISAF